MNAGLITTRALLAALLLVVAANPATAADLPLHEAPATVCFTPGGNGTAAIVESSMQILGRDLDSVVTS